MIATVFLSYASEDFKSVRYIYNILAELGCAVWMDVDRLEPGFQWESTIYSSLADRQFFIACLTRNSVEKVGFVQREFAMAVNLASDQFTVIPLVIRPCTVPPDLQSFQWIKWRDIDALPRLMSVLQPDNKAIYTQLQAWIKTTGDQQARIDAILNMAEQRSLMALLTLHEWFRREKDGTLRFWIARAIGTFGTARAQQSLNDLVQWENDRQTSGALDEQAAHEIALMGLQDGLAICQAALGATSGMDGMG